MTIHIPVGFSSVPRWVICYQYCHCRTQIPLYGRNAHPTQNLETHTSTPEMPTPPKTLNPTPPFGHPSLGGELSSPNFPHEAEAQSQNSPPREGCPTGGVENKNITNKTIVTTINNTPIYRNFVENLPYNGALSQLAKNKRKAGILSEVLFWQQVHKGIFHKIDFDRQRIIGNYIVDFYVKTLGLVVEIDGSSHNNKQEYDANRQAYLESYGLKVYRITDIDVKKNLSNAMKRLEHYIVNEYSTPHRPKP